MPVTYIIIQLFLAVIFGSIAYLGVTSQGVLVNEIKKVDNAGRVQKLECQYYTGLSIVSQLKTGIFDTSCPFLQKF